MNATVGVEWGRGTADGLLENAPRGLTVYQGHFRAKRCW